MFLKNRRIAVQITDELVAQRAYAIWQARGCPKGDGQEDWQAAETQLMAEAARQRRPLQRLFSRFRNRAALA